MKIRIIVTDSDGPRQYVSDSAISFGTDAGATIRLTGPGIMDYHASLGFDGNKVELMALHPGISCEIDSKNTSVEAGTTVELSQIGVFKIGVISVQYACEADAKPDLSMAFMESPAASSSLPAASFSLSADFFAPRASKKTENYGDASSSSSTRYTMGEEEEEEKESSDHQAEKRRKSATDAFVAIEKRLFESTPNKAGTALRLSCGRVDLGLGYVDVDDAPDDEKTPIARIYISGRYIEFLGVGGLKYGAVDCSEIYKQDACEFIRKQRGHGNIKFAFEMCLERHLPEQVEEQKVMVVPTVGCPKALNTVERCRTLLWGANGRARPTFLIVHHLEAKVYLRELERILQELGVGIISWTTERPIYGFGVSRLAAHAAGECFGNSGTVIMCDVNVLNSTDLDKGYATEPDDILPENSKFKLVQSSAMYVSVGRGSGIPLKQFDGDSLVKIPRAKAGSDARPIEQVVIVGDELRFDPCFIMSSEDFDLSEAFLEDQRSFPAADGSARNLGFPSYKFEFKIEKVAIGGGGHTNDYFIERSNYLIGLSEEDDYLVRIPKEVEEGKKKSKKKKKTKRTDSDFEDITIGDAAARVVSKLVNKGKVFENAQEKAAFTLEIRSLIIEKILLLANENRRLTEAAQRAQAGKAKGKK